MITGIRDVEMNIIVLYDASNQNEFQTKLDLYNKIKSRMIPKIQRKSTAIRAAGGTREIVSNTLWGHIVCSFFDSMF